MYNLTKTNTDLADVVTYWTAVIPFRPPYLRQIIETSNLILSVQLVYLDCRLQQFVTL